jgi:hypothetical protein
MNKENRLWLLKDKRTQGVWLVLVLGWAIFRAVAINKFFGEHNVNSRNYLAVDLASSVPYAKYSARAVVNYLDKDWRTFRKSTAITVLCFYIPDLYVLVFARMVPRSLYLGFGISITIFSLIALIGFRKDISKPKG